MGGSITDQENNLTKEWRAFGLPFINPLSFTRIKASGIRAGFVSRQ